MNLVGAHNHAWIRTSPLFRHAMESGYTLTLIRGRSPREVLRAMEAEPRGTGQGTAGLIEADDAHRAEVDYDYWDAQELFETEQGEVTAFVPVAGPTGQAAAGRAEALVLPAAEYAVAVHTGLAEDLGRTFAALGTFVAKHAISVNAPLREHTSAAESTPTTDSPTHIEVCWPVFRTAHSPPTSSGPHT